ncbi:FUSC family protein [Sphingomonas sp.]|uniref:FUSC family protein n=1 Tax=Sphingomonas sp. TaxID=28214 RepID=UPI00260FF281|nr:FUSC family protein [Sphingomonas sp.]
MLRFGTDGPVEAVTDGPGAAQKPPRMTRFQRLKLLILGADPALLALRMSGCIVVAMALVCGVLTLIGKWYTIPRPAYVLALIATMQGALQINDRTAAARGLTRIYAALAAFCAIAVISALHGALHYINIALVIIVFAATYAARFGARWRAVGVFTFMCAVVAAYLKEDERDLRTVAAALVISGGVVHVIRNAVMPDNPALDFRRLVDAVLSVAKQLRGIAPAALAHATSPLPAAHRRREDLRLAGSALSTGIRACETSLPLETPDQDTGETTIALKLLDLQVAAETLVGQSEAGAQNARPPAHDGVERALQEMREAEMALKSAVAGLPPTFPSAGAGGPPEHKAGLFPKRGEWLRDQTLRRSLQVTLACAIAAILGEAISTQRWFWAVISTFMIFNNTQSGAAVAVRGLDRAWGTAIGIVIGIALATLTHDHLLWLSAALAISVFVTFFIARVSYVAMSLFLTISLSLIYGLIGIFTPELLVLRLEETAIGVASGVLVALLLFPISLHQQARKAMDGLLTALGDLLQAIAKAGPNGRERSMARKAAAVDRALGTVLATVGPLRSTWSLGNMMTAGRDTLREAYVMAYAAHRLERSFREVPPPEQDAARLLALSERLKSAAGGKDAETHGEKTAAQSERSEVAAPDDRTESSLTILARMLDGIERARQPS